MSDGVIHPAHKCKICGEEVAALTLDGGEMHCHVRPSVEPTLPGSLFRFGRSLYAVIEVTPQLVLERKATSFGEPLPEAPVLEEAARLWLKDLEIGGVHEISPRRERLYGVRITDIEDDGRWVRAKYYVEVAA